MPTTSTEQQRRRRAKKAGLYYVNDFDRGIQRRRCGRGFTYVGFSGKTITSGRTRERIESLVIPPAWEDVWICPKPNGHIQVRGKDEAGRTQYLYHEAWQAVSAAAKYDRLHLLAELLPRLRRRVLKDLNRKRLHRQRVLAAVVRLLDKSHLRVGNEQYVRERGSRGATTLDSKNVDVDGIRVSLDFPGKSGKQRELEFSDRKVARVIQQCEELDGQFLFCYEDDAGEPVHVDSTDVNGYLQAVTGEHITAKDFRTWWGSVLALKSLEDLPQQASSKERKKYAREAVAAAAEELGNTKAVCRGSYIHPGLLAAAESGELPKMIKKAAALSDEEQELTQAENLLAALLPHLEFS